MTKHSHIHRHHERYGFELLPEWVDYFRLHRRLHPNALLVALHHADGNAEKAVGDVMARLRHATGIAS